MPLVDLTHNEVSTILYYVEGGIQGENLSKESEEEMLIAELARLTTLLNLYENNEEFMKAAIIKRKLEILHDKLNKL